MQPDLDRFLAWIPSTAGGPGTRIKVAFLGLLATMLLGSIGYSISEERSFVDALWLTLVTSTTVGYGDDFPRGLAARLVTVFIMVGGFLSVSLATASFVELLVEGRVARMLGRRSVDKKIATLAQHYIICGYGRMGKLICREISGRVPVVIIENTEEECRRLEEDGQLYINGDATEDEILERSGIKRARGLVSVVASDAENVFIALTAREMNRDLYILARAIDERSERKLLRAGADKVISPYLIGGLRLAQAILKPAVVDFMEFAFQNDSLDVHIEEVRVAEISDLANRKLQSSGISAYNVIILAIQRGNGRMEFNPSRETIISAGDTLIALGATPGLNALQARAHGASNEPDPESPKNPGRAEVEGAP